eukprot:3551762-Pleurochrysis_carterae.AAC.1
MRALFSRAWSASRRRAAHEMSAWYLRAATTAMALPTQVRLADTVRPRLFEACVACASANSSPQ